MINFKRLLLTVSLGIVILASLLGGALGERLFGFKILDRWFPHQKLALDKKEVDAGTRVVVDEESVVIDVVEKVSPSVVTVSIKTTQKSLSLENLYDPFSFFEKPQVQEKNIEQDIGTGFIVREDGLVVTNRHVVQDARASYKVITKDDKEYQVEKIYRDPANDLAILKISGSGFKAVELGDSSKLKVGQLAIAIGTPLGEFRQSVTTGVISGLGRGLQAGDPFSGYVEKLDDVIQTDAAINPGNSGGPLLNSSAQVIGVNVAVSQSGQNLGFALPINVVKDSLAEFEETGSFQRAFLGVSYKVISRDLAVANEVPEGAYVLEVIEGSAAEKAGIKKSDIITKLDDKKIQEKEENLANIISKKRAGDKIKIEFWRDGKTQVAEAVLQESSS